MAIKHTPTLVSTNGNGPDYLTGNYTTQVFEWASSSGGGDVTDYRTSPPKTYPFTTTMTLIVEAGFNYYLIRLFYEPSVDGSGTLFVNGTFYGDDYNDFNRAYGAGQTFKLLSGYNATPNDYLPKNYTPPQLPVASLGQLGGTNNLQTGKIDINTGLAELKGPRGDTGNLKSFNSHL